MYSKDIYAGGRDMYAGESGGFWPGFIVGVLVGAGVVWLLL